MDGQSHIAEFWAVICTDVDGTEGVPAIRGDLGRIFPLYTANPANLPYFKRAALQLSMERGTKCVIAKFTAREDIETFSAPER